MVGIVILLLVTLPFIFRIIKDIKKKLNIKNAYAIQNIETGKDLRVHNANIDNGTEIILYNHKKWECITWEFIELEENTFLLKNLYTQKTFQPSSNSPSKGDKLIQKELGGSTLQYWEFLKENNGNYLIRLKGTELYLTSSSTETNAPVVLMEKLPKQNPNKQLWKLIKQNPIV